MGKSYFDETDEQRGSLPALTGALLEVTGIERSKTGEKSKNPGIRMYVVEFKVVEPKQYQGSTLRDWIVVGTAEDPFAKRPETWKRAEGGPGRLKRLLTRSGTPLTDDDEEWMEAAEGHQVVAPVSARPSDDGDQVFNRPGLYYRPSDEDCPEIGEAEAKAGKGGKGKTAKATTSKKPAKDTEGEEGEEEKEEKPKTGKAGKATSKPKDEDEDEDEE